MTPNKPRVSAWIHRPQLLTEKEPETGEELFVVLMQQKRNSMNLELLNLSCVLIRLYSFSENLKYEVADIYFFTFRVSM